jgi:hypothetical protein
VVQIYFVCLSLTLPPTSASQTPALPHFLKTSSLSLTLTPTSASHTPVLPHFLKTSSVPCRPLQAPKPQRFPTSSRLHLSRLPCGPLQAPKPQRFPTSSRLRLSLAYPAAHFSLPNPSTPPTSSKTLYSSHDTPGVSSCEEASRDIASRRSFSQAHDVTHSPSTGKIVHFLFLCSVSPAPACRQDNSDWNRFPCASGCLKVVQAGAL